ncbi:ABC transporter substrate-binding protein [Rhodopseudomonas sp. P2A-2r]|uniref:ABC transporter substrate-binding protein n=1 Tax=unclassified Rhodopseudomonas TaxID=2638247 RepID=UPI0022346BC0|nr:ABC transporter substrate-binding protein [Rhodopseudomonas sp. P2A-2r]UZE50800.1 ABC transporter substrate-binding protein [Rhodopseudomonas sp. P2A-2r]
MIGHHGFRGLRTLALALAVTAGPFATAQAQTRIKMILNWKYEGPQGMLFLADDRGYFKAEGLDVTFDQGNGSGAAVPQVANGAYDMGFGDINALIELAAKKPDEAPIGVYQMYNRPPFTVAVKAGSAIKTPADFIGKKLGGAANDGALKLFPALCATAKIDCAKVEITNMQPNLREQMLMKDQVDGVFGYITTIRFSAKLIGVDPDKELRFIKFGDYGMDLYSNAIIVSRKFAKENPAAVKGFLKALNHGIKDAMADPKAAVDAVAKRESLIKQDVELARLNATFADEMNAPEIAKIGHGDISDIRMAKAIDILVSAKELPRTPKVNEIFDRSFMPPLSERPTAIKAAM